MALLEQHEAHPPLELRDEALCAKRESNLGPAKVAPFVELVQAERMKVVQVAHRAFEHKGLDTFNQGCIEPELTSDFVCHLGYACGRRLPDIDAG
mgnify:CR=1 FL=1